MLSQNSKNGPLLSSGRFHVERDVETETILKRCSLSHKTLCARLRHEAKMWARVGDKVQRRLVELYETDEELVARFNDVPGEPLSEIESPLPTGVLRDFAESLLSELTALHQAGLLHTNLRPEHVLWDAQSRAVHVLSLSAAVPHLEARCVADVGAEPAELRYVAPEQTGFGTMDLRPNTDLYSAGLVIIRAGTGREPRHPRECALLTRLQHFETRARLDGADITLPAGIRILVERLTERNPDERYSRASSALRDIQEVTLDGAGFVPDVRDRATTPNYPGPVPGLAGPLARLAHLWDSGLASGSSLTLVTCRSLETGSHLLSAAATHALAHGVLALHVSRREIGPLPLLESLYRLLLLIEGSTSHRHDSLRKALSGLKCFGALSSFRSFCARLLDLDDRRRGYAVGFLRVLKAMAGAGAPIVIAIDDIARLGPCERVCLHDFVAAGLDGLHVLVRLASLDAPELGDLSERAHESSLHYLVEVNPLSAAETASIVGRALNGSTAAVLPLVNMLHLRSGGERSFLSGLLRFVGDCDGLAFDEAADAWVWKPGAPVNCELPSNPVDLAAARFARLPEQPQHLMRMVAHLGSGVEFELIAALLDTTIEEMLAALDGAFAAGFVAPVYGPNERRRLVVTCDDLGGVAAAGTRCAEILRRAAHWLREMPSQHPRAARYLLRSRELSHPDVSINMLAESAAEGAHAALAVGSIDQAAELAMCALKLDADQGANDQVASVLIRVAGCVSAEALGWNLELDWTEAQGLERLAKFAMWSNRNADFDHIVEESLSVLKEAGVDLPPWPADDPELWVAYGIEGTEGARSPSERTAFQAAVFDFVTDMHQRALRAGGLRFNALTAVLVRWSYTHGHRCGGGLARALFASVLANPRFGEYALALRLCNEETPEGTLVSDDRYAALVLANVLPWSVPQTKWLKPLARLRAQDGSFVANRSATTFVSALAQIATSRDYLATVQEVERSFQSRSFTVVTETDLRIIKTHTQVLLAMAAGGEGAADAYETPSGECPRELAHRAACEVMRQVVVADYGAAVDAALVFHQLEHLVLPGIWLCNYRVCEALAICKGLGDAAGRRKTTLLRRLDQTMELFEQWALRVPTVFESMVRLVHAEYARYQDNHAEAREYYDQAISIAAENQQETGLALANQLAAEYSAERGYGHLANHYAEAALHKWESLGAFGMAEPLRAKCENLPSPLLLAPSLSDSHMLQSVNNLSISPGGLDPVALAAATQAMSAGIELDQVAENVLLTLGLHTNADVALLVLNDADQVALASKSEGELYARLLSQEELRSADVSVALFLVDAVLRTQQSIIVHDAGVDQRYNFGHFTGSIFCTPLRYRGRDIGLFYLHNREQCGVYTPVQVAYLEILLSQAAISLENARLYETVAHHDRETTLVLEAVQDAIVSISEAGDVTFANRRVAEVFGYPSQALVGWPIQLLVKSERFTDRLHELKRKTLNEQLAVSEVFQVQGLHANGHEFPLEVCIGATANNGEITYAGTLRDVTEREMASQALKRSEERFRVLSENSNDAVIMCNDGEMIVYANSAAHTMFRYRDGDLIGRDLNVLIPPRARASHAHHLQTYVETGHAQINWRRRPQTGWRSDGVEFPIEISLCEIKQGNGDRLLAGIVRDITTQVERESERQEAINLLGATLDGAPYAIIATDQDGVIRIFNRTASRWLGYTQREIIGIKTPAIWHVREEVEERALVLTEELGRDVPAGFEALVARARLGAVDRNEWTYVRKDGTMFPVELSVTTLRDESGAVTGFVGFADDITEERMAKAAIEEVTAELSARVSELQARERNHNALNELNSLLQACIMEEEAYQVLATRMRDVFPDSSGALAMLKPGANLLEVKSTWGDLEGNHVFGREDCWALRRGRAHTLVEQGLGMCKHAHGLHYRSSGCFPLIARGELLGVLHVDTPEAAAFAGGRLRFAETVADELELVLSNLRLQETLRNQSIRDPLTGIFNRRYMEETLERELLRAQRHSQPLSVIMMDVDHFKRYNDTHGHDAGDQVLRRVGDLLQFAIRGEDVACRFGGEEFALILPGCSKEDAAARAEYLRNMLSTVELRLEGRPPLAPVTASFGVASYPLDAEHGPRLMATADAALYQAKNEGRDRVVAYNSSGFTKPKAEPELVPPPMDRRH